MKLFFPDYSSAYNANRARGAAKSSTYLADSVRLVTEGHRIRSKQLKIERDANRAAYRQQAIGNVLGAIQVGTQLGTAIYGIMEQAEMQRAKKFALEAQQNLRTTAREAYLNGEFTPTIENGKVVDLGTPDRLANLRAEYESQLETKFKMKTVKGYASQALQGAFDDAANFGIDNAIVQYVKERDQTSDALMSQAVNIAVSTGSDEGIIAQARSEEWRSKEAQDLRIAEYQEQAKYGKADTVVTQLTQREGKQAALAAFESIRGAFGEDQQKRLIAKIGSEDKAVYDAAYASASTAYTQLTTDELDEAGNVTRKAVSPAEAIRGIESAWTGREQDRAAVVEELRKSQESAEWDNAYNIFNRDRSDIPNYSSLKKLKADFWEFQHGVYEDRFDGIDKTHKQVLDMFENEIKSMEAKLTGEDGNLSQEAAKLWQAYQDKRPGSDGRPMRWEVARSGLIDILDRGGPSAAIISYIAKGDSGGRPEYVPSLEGFMTAMSGMMTKADPVEKGRIQRLMQETMSAAGSMIGKGMSVSEIKTSLDTALAIEVSKEYDRIKNTIDFGVKAETFDTSGAGQMAAYLKRAQTGEFDDLVYVDTATGTQRFTRTDAGMKQMMAKSEEMLKAAGIDIKDGSTKFDRQGKDDVGATWTTKGKDGATYAVRTDNGKDIYPAKLVDGKWVDVSPAKKVVAPPDVKAVQTQATKEQKLKDDTVAMYVKQLDGLRSDSARRMKMVDLITTGLATWDDFGRAGYDKNGRKK